MQNFINYKDNKYLKKGGWIQKQSKSIKKRGTEGVCTGSKFGSSSCPPGSKRYNLQKTFRKMQKKQEGGLITNNMATNTPVKRKQGTQSTAQNPEQQEQQEFLMWLQKQLQVQSEEELRQKMKEMGEQGLQEAYMAFKQAKQQGQATAMKKGGMLKHIEQLIQFKCGGKTKKKKMKQEGGKMPLTPYEKKPAGDAKKMIGPQKLKTMKDIASKKKLDPSKTPMKPKNK